MAAEVRSSRDVVTEALRSLNIIPGDAEPAGFELDNTLARWEELCADLADDEYVEFEVDAVPVEVFRACWRLLADAIAPSYGRAQGADPDDPSHPSRVRLLRRMANLDDGDVVEIQEF